MSKCWFGLAAVGLLVAGCSGTQTASEPVATTPVATSPTTSHTPVTEPSSDSTTTTPATSPAEPGDAGGPPGTLDYDTGQTLEPAGAEPVWDGQARSAATSSAVAVLSAFCHSDLPLADWWAALAPMLSEQAQIDYQYVDPANVPAATVTGAGVLADDTSPLVAIVEVPTDLGTFTVTLTRAGAGAPWLAERITPPEGIH